MHIFIFEKYFVLSFDKSKIQLSMCKNIFKVHATYKIMSLQKFLHATFLGLWWGRVISKKQL